jgi:histidyl-tRNA synthetase
MGVERVVELLVQAQQVPVPATADVYVVVNGARASAAGPVIVERLRDQLPRVRFELNLGGGNFKAQFRRADRSGAALALIVGDDELARGVAGVKPLRQEAGQTECPIAELGASITAALALDPRESRHS